MFKTYYDAKYKNTFNNDNVMTWERFPNYWPFVWRIHGPQRASEVISSLMLLNKLRGFRRFGAP